MIFVEFTTEMTLPCLVSTPREQMGGRLGRMMFYRNLGIYLASLASSSSFIRFILACSLLRAIRAILSADIVRAAELGSPWLYEDTFALYQFRLVCFSRPREYISLFNRLLFDMGIRIINRRGGSKVIVIVIILSFCFSFPFSRFY